MSDTNKNAAPQSLEKSAHIGLISVNGETLPFNPPDEFCSQSVADPVADETTVKSCSIVTYLVEAILESFALAGACMCLAPFDRFYSHGTDAGSTTTDPDDKPLSPGLKSPL